MSVFMTEFKYGGILEGSTEYYEGKKAAVVFMAGCPLRCGYCFSAPLILSSQEWQVSDTERLMEYFERKKAEMEAVVFTGAEPLHQAEALMELCRKLREKEFLVRVETSGFYADALERLLPFVNNVAMDVKTTFHAEKYAQLTGFRGEPATLMQDTYRSVVILRHAKEQRPDLYVEFRTTVIPDVNDDSVLIESIAKEVSFADKYALQQFMAGPTLNDPSLEKLGDLPKFRLIELAEVAARHVKNVVLRTREDGEQPFEATTMANTQQL